MAITLDELLGMNTASTKNKESVESFPTYDDFSARSRQGEQRGETPRYNFESRPATPPRTTDYMRNYEMTRNYEAPRQTEYQQSSFDIYDVAAKRRTAVEPPQQADDRDYGYTGYRSYANPSYQTAEKRNNLYEFTLKDNDRLSAEELDSKLGGRGVSTMTATRPMTQQVTRESTARVEDPVRERQSVFTPQKSEYKSESAKKARLNTKGKILLAVYLAVIILVAVLVIVNAGDINSGTAKTPSSSVNEYTVSSENISADYEINSSYDAVYQIR